MNRDIIRKALSSLLGCVPNPKNSKRNAYLQVVKKQYNEAIAELDKQEEMEETIRGLATGNNMEHARVDALKCALSKALERLSAYDGEENNDLAAILTEHEERKEPMHTYYVSGTGMYQFGLLPEKFQKHFRTRPEAYAMREIMAKELDQSILYFDVKETVEPLK